MRIRLYEFDEADGSTQRAILSKPQEVGSLQIQAAIQRSETTLLHEAGQQISSGGLYKVAKKNLEGQVTESPSIE